MAKEFNLLVKNTSILAGTRLIQFLTGLLRIKISAIILGTVGIGIVDQLTFLTNKISQFTTVGTAEAFVKQLAESKEKEKVNELISSAFKSYILVIFGFVIFSVIFLLYFSDSMTVYIFGENSNKSYFYIALFTFPILVLGSLPFSILKAFKDVKSISKSRIWIVLIQILIAIPIILIYKLPGAVIYVPISYLIDFLFVYYFANKFYFKKYQVSISSIWKAPLVPSFVKELFVFSGFGLTVGVYLIFSEFFCRSIVVSHLGVEAIGLYSPVIMFASVFTGFILPALSTYLYPRFCELKLNAEISGLINDALRLGTICLTPLLFIGIPFQHLIIGIFYSSDFLEATKYLPFHFIGIIFYVWWYVLSQSLTPTGRIKVHGIFRLFFFTIDIITTYFFVEYFGLYGWMMKHVMSPFIFFWVYSYYVKSNMGFKLKKSNYAIMFYLLGGSIFLIISFNFFKYGVVINYFLGPILLIGTFFLLKESEKVYIQDKILNISSRVNK